MYFQEQEKKYKKVAGNGRESVSPLSRANILRPPSRERPAWPKIPDISFFRFPGNRSRVPFLPFPSPRPANGFFLS